MNCSNCGAPMRGVRDADHFVCDFCASFHFPQRNLDGVAILGGPGQRKCPVCAEALISAAVQRKPVEHCSKCQGVLSDRRAFNGIVEQLRARNRRPRQDPRPIDPAERDRLLLCPVCKAPMEVHPYYGPGNVLLDSCHVCNLVWLDHGEIASLGRS
jgi:Zn-finger nucleic acid-binding protein